MGECGEKDWLEISAREEVGVVIFGCAWRSSERTDCDQSASRIGAATFGGSKRMCR